MKLVNLATAAVFAVFLAAPIGSLALFGPDEMAEKVVTAKELNSARLYMPDDGYRDDVARRLVNNSPVGMDAISAKNSLDFKVFGFVNTDQVISGEDGWLFYKPGFQNGTCLSDRDIGVMLGRIEAMRTIALAAGIDYRVSVSPDKEVVYPERLGIAAEAAAGCKIRSSRKWREAAKISGSSVIDHLEVMDHDVVDDLLYFKTDTHWNELGKIKAFGQLVREFMGREVSGKVAPSDKISHHTDIPKRILKFFQEEEKNIYDDYITQNYDIRSADKIANTIIIHDSFYGISSELIQRIFLNPKLVNFRDPNRGQRIYNSFENNPQRVLVNTVERSLKPRIEKDLSWTGALGKAFIAANAKAARKCPMSDAAKDSLTLKNISEQPGGNFAAGVDPQIYVKLPDDGRPCVRISFDTTVKQPTFIHLPIRNPVNQNGPYFEGFSVTLTDSPGQRDIWVVLPEEFSGTTLRIDPIAANGLLSKLTVQTGSLPSISVTRN